MAHNDDTPHAKHANCLACGLYKTCNTPFMVGSAVDPTPSPIMFVGEAPGYHEDNAGTPFVGESGRLLWAAAKSVGIEIDQVHVQNAVRCRPENNKIQGVTAINMCRPFLLAEIERVRPSAILLLGDKALQSVAKRKGITKARAQAMTYTFQDGATIPMSAAFHPAYILRNQNLKGRFLDDMRYFKDMVEGKQRVVDVNDIVTCATAAQLSKAYFKWLTTHACIACDFETSQLNPYLDSNWITMCVSLSDGKDTYVVKVDGCFAKGEPLQRAAAETPEVRWLKKILACAGIKKVNHNIKYDMHVAEQRLQVPIKNVVGDTMLLHALLYPMEGGHDLDTVVAEQLKVDRYKSMLNPHMGESDDPAKYARVPYGVLSAYAGIDAKVVPKINKRMMVKLRTMDKENVDLGLPGMPPSEMYARVVIPGMLALQRVERRGFAVDVPYMESLSKALETEEKALVRRIRKNPVVQRYEGRRLRLGLAEIRKRAEVTGRQPTEKRRLAVVVDAQHNPGSYDQLNQLLYTKQYFGVDPKQHNIKKTDSGKGYKTDAETLENIASALRETPEDNGVVDYCTTRVKYMNVQKMRGTYVDGLLRDHIGQCRRIYGTFHQGRARTGRLSSSDPNLQNIPRDLRFRRMFVAKKGCVLVTADYSQIELRALAAFSKDPALIQIYEDDLDIHTDTARRMFEVDPPTKEQRQAAKPVNFGIVYGLQATGLRRNLASEDLIYTHDECEAFIQKWFENYEEVLKWQTYIKNFASQHGFVYSLFGRRRLLEDARISRGRVSDELRFRREEALRQAVNTPIQSTASDICLVSLIALENTLSKLDHYAGIVSTVHDSIMIECDKRHAQATARLVKRVMEKHPLRFMKGTWNVPIKVDMAIGKNWADAEPFEDAA